MLKSLRPLLPYMRKYRAGYIFGTISVLLDNSIWILFPLIIGRAIDDLRVLVSFRDAAAAAGSFFHAIAFAQQSDFLFAIRDQLGPAIRHNVIRHAWELMAVAAAKGVFRFLTRWIVIGISRDIEFDLRNDLFRQLERLSYGFYQRMRTGDIMARATNDLNAVRMLLGPAIMYSANTLVFTVGALVVMTRISPRLTAWAFLPLPVVSIVVQYFGGRIHERFERIQAQFADISARAQENFSAARVIRAYVQEQAEIASFETDNKEYIARSLKLVRLMGMLWPTLETMLGLAIVLVLWLGGREAINGRITPGNFAAFLMFMMQLSWPVIALGWVINLFQRGTASLQRIDHIMKERPEIADRDVGPPLSSEVGGPPLRSKGGSLIDGEIEFRDLSFRYDGIPVLADINLRISAGSSLAIVGPTGSGKSTLVSLIARIYDAAPGMVLIDGRPIREYSLETLRRSIGFVPQETFLFGESVCENIALGVEDASLDEVRRAAQAAGIAHEIESFPASYQTLVGERGITLSGGQKQRAAIARALIRNPRILVLDDALSSVDTQTEDHILNHLRDVMRGRTTIFISHRVSTVRNADRIAVLHGGRIVEYGAHDELLALNGYYTDLYNKQLLEEELARA